MSIKKFNMGLSNKKIKKKKFLKNNFDQSYNQYKTGDF